MEHDDISLDSKPSNRQNAGRYGSKTNKTIKYSRNAKYDHRKGPETIVQIEDTHREGWEVSYRGAEKSVGISLNARKNWEWVEKQVAHQEGHNNLRRSQDGTLENISIFARRNLKLAGIPYSDKYCWKISAFIIYIARYN
jgi:hypothetical protein